jgi:thioredoxin-like negative regulator of GroEL
VAKLISDEGLDRYVLSGHGYAAVCFFDFTSEPCKKFRPEWLGLSELMPDLPVYELEAAENPGITRELGVLVAPTTVLFLDGTLLDRYEGPYTRQALMERIKRAMSKKK